MSTALFYSDRFLDHDTGQDHPERPERLRAVVTRLRATGLWDRCTHPAFEAASREDLLTVHDEAYLQRIERACGRGEPWIDAPDSAICPASDEIARLASGAVLGAVEEVMTGRAGRAFALVRPPGHHAERDRSMGFCLYNHVAIAAERLLRRHGLSRVAVVDFDVHHGNGTQHSFETSDRVFFVSLHEHPRHLYPGTGFAHERGRGRGEGCTLNVPLLPGSGDDEYRDAFDSLVCPALDAYQPQFLLVSAGFDAAAGDPLAHQRVTTQGFAWIGQTLGALAQRHCGGRWVSTLEGGYKLDALAEGVEAYLRAQLALG
jgi:acetoin utilization deacetylase AcuC-like enzyme